MLLIWLLSRLLIGGLVRRGRLPIIRRLRTVGRLIGRLRRWRGLLPLLPTLLVWLIVLIHGDFLSLVVGEKRITPRGKW